MRIELKNITTRAMRPDNADTSQRNPFDFENDRKFNTCVKNVALYLTITRSFSAGMAA